MPTKNMSEKTVSFMEVICREPYRIFFPLGVVFAMFGVGHWFLYAIGWLKHYSGFYHSSVQIMAYMGAFVFGFLLTALPRFSGMPSTTPLELASFVLGIIGVFACLMMQEFMMAYVFFMICLLLLVRFAFVRVLKKKNPLLSAPPKEFVWIPIAVMHGIVGCVLVILGQLKIIGPPWMTAGKPMVEQGFLLSVIAGVGGFLLPRLMGTYSKKGRPDDVSFDRIFKIEQMKIPFHLVMGGILFITFFIEGTGQTALAYALRGSVIFAIFLSNKILPRLPVVQDLFVMLVWVSTWMISAGLWLVAIFPEYRVALLHIVFIGGFSLLAFSIATMVVLSHAGQARMLARPLVIFWIIGIGILAALMNRLCVLYDPDSYFRFLGVASLIWMVMGLSWLCYAAPRIFILLRRIPRSLLRG